MIHDGDHSDHKKRGNIITMPHIFRQAEAEDIAELRRLARSIWYEAYSSILLKEQIEYMLEMMYSEEVIRGELLSGVVWDLIVCEGTSCGYLSYLSTEDNEVKLSKIYIEKAFRGKSIAADALRRVIEYAAQKYKDHVFLTVNKNNKMAIRAYEKNGFIISDSVVTDIGNGFVMDDYIMKYKITGQAKLSI
jgi:diamine N-acetyltransferase